ncbi:hypothetical protein THAOC_32874 [Thalassiosira oceanica]|uniref:Uncharacterized protein n=1 Tax=Thalassiosira oceanica TaxID=159749 RepID=K0R6A6_THAOC|nr:hypothetical protein THAOC_32874 [Thalassiosira oceanica]|eukprot:EJK48340.1 hypothetical protein THAOC_32874 [Thalassiosira oceanica]
MQAPGGALSHCQSATPSHPNKRGSSWNCLDTIVFRIDPQTVNTWPRGHALTAADLRRTKQGRHGGNAD